MHFWIYLFSVPVALLALVLIFLVLRERAELRRVSTWAAILSGFAAWGFAIWGFVHRNQINLPLAYDPGFDKRALAIFVAATLFALAWLVQTRRSYSFLTFALSFVGAAFWTAVVKPL